MGSAMTSCGRNTSLLHPCMQPGQQNFIKAIVATHFQLICQSLHRQDAQPPARIHPMLDCGWVHPMLDCGWVHPMLECGWVHPMLDGE